MQKYCKSIGKILKDKNTPDNSKNAIQDHPKNLTLSDNMAIYDLSQAESSLVKRIQAESS